MAKEKKGAEEMVEAEKEIGKNIPDGMKGLDTEDVGDVESSSDDTTRV